MTNMQVEYWKLMETKRHNIAMEGETQRHDVEQERIGYAQASASYQQAAAAQRNAEINFLNYQLQSEYQPYQIKKSLAESSKIGAEAMFTASKTRQQQLETKSYERYGMLSSYYNAWSQYYDIQRTIADTQLKYNQAGSYEFTNFKNSLGALADYAGAVTGILALIG